MKVGNRSSSAIDNIPLLVIVGPTAVGKTAVSMRLAAEFSGEIISADSRLLYRGMNIGTAKPTSAEQVEVPHHLIDICNPDEILTLAQYQKLAYAAIDGVHARERLPILVGGTGQYVKAIVEGWQIPEVAPNPHLRAALESLGDEELGRWLSVLDPVTSNRIDKRNVRRVIRALEVTLTKGRPISWLRRKIPPPYIINIVGLHRDRKSLYQIVDRRVDQMMANGLLSEVENLRDAGYGRSLPAMSGLGYMQLWAYLDGEMTLAEAVERIKFETHRFVRQQATWFRQDDSRITWFDAANMEMEETIIRYVRSWLKKSFNGG